MRHASEDGDILGLGRECPTYSRYTDWEKSEQTNERIRESPVETKAAGGTAFCLDDGKWRRCGTIPKLQGVAWCGLGPRRRQ